MLFSDFQSALMLYETRIGLVYVVIALQENTQLLTDIHCNSIGTIILHDIVLNIVHMCSLQALVTAAEGGNLQKVKLCLQNDADIEYKDVGKLVKVKTTVYKFD